MSADDTSSGEIPDTFVVIEDLDRLTVHLQVHRPLLSAKRHLMMALLGTMAAGALGALASSFTPMVPAWMGFMLAMPAVFFALAMGVGKVNGSRRAEYTLHLTEARLNLPDCSFLLEQIRSIVPLGETMYIQTDAGGYELPLRLRSDEQRKLHALLVAQLQRRRHALGVSEPVSTSVPAELTELLTPAQR